MPDLPVREGAHVQQTVLTPSLRLPCGHATRSHPWMHTFTPTPHLAWYRLDRRTSPRKRSASHPPSCVVVCSLDRLTLRASVMTPVPAERRPRQGWTRRPGPHVHEHQSAQPGGIDQGQAPEQRRGEDVTAAEDRGHGYQDHVSYTTKAAPKASGSRSHPGDERETARAPSRPPASPTSPLHHGQAPQHGVERPGIPQGPEADRLVR